MSTVIDHNLISRLKDSDYDAFSMIYRHYSPRVFHTVMRLFRNEDMAADVVQDLFLKIWDKRADIDPTRNFEAYIHVIARNMAYSYIKDELKKLDDVTSCEWENCIDDDDPSLALEAMSTEEFMKKMVDSMPPIRRRIFIMSRFDNLSHKEIAARLGISERTVESHIYQALKIIRKAIGFYVISSIYSSILL